ncbi:ankyrin repeat domain-containing protein [Ralstonia sp. SM1864_UCD524_TZ4]|uniref:Putative type III effector protein with ankyrin repeats n=1 Tax=Ralstonia solanacearum TaxID=305 RepID=A0A0S4VHD2_RALSL|nr:ankyrin repeat domain-containing protein [Ralstonia pseudosolanacearum]CUV23957.1 putative type III effector protein with ankyrin repeats [Ralstonia solanacearum]CUV33898.1 putative type III effector protein with ankyrin repeats [Ralstonia solanacearum]CUV40959.1 putative type III effector protein with ankyrin repeats [Ralstonia solanacearum]CUV59824.1 putative type III effector protein with ankyrin repeats [Ralstonia solanacearum]
MDFPRRHSLSPLRFLTPSRSPQTERTSGASPAPGNTPRRASGPLSGLTKGFNALFKADPEKAALRQAFSMAETGKAESLAGLLQSHPHLVMAVNANGTTLLASAAKRGHLEVVRLILARPESAILINQINKRGETPLQRAVEAGRTAVVGALLQHAEIDPNRVDKHGQTPLHIAAGNRHADITRALVEHPRTEVNRPDRDGNTALHLAVRKRGLDAAGELLRHPHIDPNQPNAKHHTPLTMAIAKLHVDCVHALASHPGVQVNRPGTDGHPPVWQAVAQFVEHLESGSFARHRVRTGKELDCLFELARSPHIDLNVIGPGGHTPLTRLACAKPHRYVQAGRDTTFTEIQHKQRVVDAVRAFLQGSSEGRNGFNPNARNIDGQVAVQIALRNGHDALASRLLQDPRTDPGAAVTRLIGKPGRLSRLLNPGGAEPKTHGAGQAFLVEQLERSIRFRNPDGTANPWISLALCEYAARFEITAEAQRRASAENRSCRPDAASYAAQALEFSMAFQQAPIIKVAAQALIHHAPRHQAHFNLGGIDVSRSEIQAWAAGDVPEAVLNAHIEQYVRDGRINVHADALLTRGQQLLNAMKRLTPEDQRRSVEQSTADLRAVIGQRSDQLKQALKAEASEAALEALAAFEAFETVEAMEAMAAEQAEDAEEAREEEEVEDAQEDEAAQARAHTEAEHQKARLKGRIDDLRNAGKGIKHLLKMGPTKEDPDYAFHANVALADTWSYVQSRKDPELKDNLTAALLLRLADVGKDVPCNTGCIQRVAFASEGIDTSLHQGEPGRGAMYEEIVSIAKAVNERYKARYGEVEAFDPAAPGTSSAPPVTARDRQAILRYTKGAEIDDDVVTDVKRDMVRADVLADLVGRRGWTRATVEELLAPILDNVAYLDALSVKASGSPDVHAGP